jgi:hypothetical protein
MDLVTLIIFLLYFLVIFGALVLLAYFVVALRRNLRSARVFWIAVCVAHLIGLLAFDYYHSYHSSMPGSLEESRFAEQFQWLSNLPTLFYCFPSSVFSFALGAALSRGLCSIVGEQACDSELAFVLIWWLIPVTFGYLQWFKVLPLLLKKFQERFPRPAVL